MKITPTEDEARFMEIDIDRLNAEVTMQDAEIRLMQVKRNRTALELEIARRRQYGNSEAL